MIVPRYWAEAKIKKRVHNRQVTVKRFGWSDESLEDAQQNADTRATGAVALIESGKQVNLLERKLAYNGADGVPIREEIIEHINDSVITRNSYGALCINTPDVLFADIDFDETPIFSLYLFSFVVLTALVIGLGLHFDSCTWALGEGCSKELMSRCTGIFLLSILLTTLAFTSLTTKLLFKIFSVITDGAQGRAKRRIKKFVSRNPAWNLNIYRTPAGFRVLALHKTFTPDSKETLNFFTALKTDPIYVQMCKNQRCFRARVSPKPWRIGLESRIKPRAGVWPISPEKLPARQHWIEGYEKASLQYASCRFEEHLGSSTLHPKAKYICSVHDKYCKAKTNLTIA